MKRVALKVPQKEINESWQRCIRHGILKDNELTKLNNNKLKKTFEENRCLIKVFEQITSSRLKLMNDNFIVFLTDENGILLDYYLGSLFKSHEISLNIKKGISFKEENAGTNAISLAIILQDNIFIRPKDHYCNLFKKWYCYAVPIHFKKKVIGYLDVSTVNKNMNKELIVITNLIADIIENNLYYNYSFKKKDSVGMTARQLYILKLLALGDTEKATAKRIGVSVNTIKYHKQKIFEVLDTNNISSTIIKALKIGLLNIEEINLS